MQRRKCGATCRPTATLPPICGLMSPREFRNRRVAGTEFSSSRLVIGWVVPAHPSPAQPPLGLGQVGEGGVRVGCLKGPKKILCAYLGACFFFVLASQEWNPSHLAGANTAWRGAPDVLPDDEALHFILQAASRDQRALVELFDVIRASQLAAQRTPAHVWVTFRNAIFVWGDGWVTVLGDSCNVKVFVRHSHAFRPFAICTLNKNPEGWWVVGSTPRSSCTACQVVHVRTLSCTSEGLVLSPILLYVSRRDSVPRRGGGTLQASPAPPPASSSRRSTARTRAAPASPTCAGRAPS